MITSNMDQVMAKIEAYVERASSEVVRAVNTTGINIQAKAKRNVRSHGMRKLPNGTTRRMLIDTGLMSSSIHLAFRRDLSDIRDAAEGSSESAASAHAQTTTARASGRKMAHAVAIGTKYAKYHELGLGVPKRAFLLPAAESERLPHLRRLKSAMKPR